MDNDEAPQHHGPHPFGWVPLACGAWMLVFGVYEVLERTWLAGAPAGLLYVLHIIRGTGTSFLLAGLAAWWMVRRSTAVARFSRSLLATLREREGLLLKTSDRLSIEQAKIEEILRNLGAAMILLDRDDTVVWANPTARRWFGEDLAGHNCHRRLWDDPLACDGCCFSRGVCHPSERVSTVDGRRRVFLVQCNPIGGFDGERLGLIQDITHIKQMQSEVEQAGKLAAIGRLAAGVAHEINNPLAAIASSAEILHCHAGLGYPDPVLAAADLQPHLERIEKNVFRCKRIIDSLLSFAHRREELLERVDLGPVLADARDLVAATARSHSVRLTGIGEEAGVDGSRELSLSASDGQRIQQVVVNLLLNAVDASSAGAPVALEAARRDGGVEVIVRDRGHGLTDEVSKHLFEPFFTTRPVGQGTGLGLYLSHQMVESLQGRISFESRPGEETVFRVWLPDDSGIERRRKLAAGLPGTGVPSDSLPPGPDPSVQRGLEALSE